MRKNKIQKIKKTIFYVVAFIYLIVALGICGNMDYQTEIDEYNIRNGIVAEIEK